MAAVFPESMDKLDVNNPASSLSIIENHIRYMQERVEFSMRNVTRTVSAAGISSAETYVLLVALQNSLSSLASTVQSMAGDITSIKTELGQVKGGITTLETRVGAAEIAVTSLQDTVNGIQTSVGAIQGAVNALQNSLSSLEARVEALEQTPPTTS